MEDDPLARPVSQPRFVLVRSWPVQPSVTAAFTRCQGKGCGRTIEPGEQVSLVVERRPATVAPDNPATRRYLCDACVAKLGDRLERPNPWESDRRPALGVVDAIGDQW